MIIFVIKILFTSINIISSGLCKICRLDNVSSVDKPQKSLWDGGDFPSALMGLKLDDIKGVKSPAGVQWQAMTPHAVEMMRHLWQQN